ncbi:MAG TPA: BamA/TamA family outer membrane protein [Flavisolibacter sp.]|nr:BamA/TamA family outer membrane protein [Flavisolibacter sp.]
MFLSKKNLLIQVPFFFFIVCLLFSCTTVRNYPVNRPYVYETNINIDDNFNNDKKDLALQLEQQLHDSVRVRTVSRLMFQVLMNPPAFDSIHASQSITFMRALLQSLGYYRDSIRFTTKIDTVAAGNLPTTINFFVSPGRRTRIDSISYNISADSTEQSSRYKQELDTLQKITINSLDEALIKKGDPFSKYTISAERDRLADVYRNNGYLRYSQEEMIVLWDTVGLALIRPTIDPIEQARQLEELRRRRANPTASVEFRLRESPDSTRITRYYVGNVTVFPDLTADTASFTRIDDIVNGYRFISYANLFKNRKLTDYIFLKRGELYRQNKYLRTQNKFSSLGAWRFVNIVQLPRENQDTVDFEIRLTPARKYAFNANLEGSRNQGNLSIAEGNLIGLGITLGLQNRNFARAANQAGTNFRYGTELNATTANLIQTRQITLNHTIQFPRLVPRINWLYNPESDKEVRTIFSLNAGNTDRRRYYNLTTLNTSWGFEKSWRNKLLGIRLPNIEYNFLQRRSLLDTLIDRNASYRYIFNTGFILSSLINFNVASGGENITKLFSSSIEFPLVPVQLRKDFYRFIKLDAEYRQTHTIRRTAFAWRVFGGLGAGMPFNTLDSINRYLPFFRAYYAGGPNSMRAWGVRKLGPGSSIRSFERTEAPDRFGDLKLEANAEYRFFLFSYNGITFNSALFTDIGNVWFLRKNLDFPGGEFRFDKLAKDLAIGLGTGLRLDFGFLKVRFDYAYKVKDPSPENVANQNKLFHNWKLRNGQFQLGIDYPF